MRIGTLIKTSVHHSHRVHSKEVHPVNEWTSSFQNCELVQFIQLKGSFNWTSSRMTDPSLILVRLRTALSNSLVTSAKQCGRHWKKKAFFPTEYQFARIKTWRLLSALWLLRLVLQQIWPQCRNNVNNFFFRWSVVSFVWIYKFTKLSYLVNEELARLWRYFPAPNQSSSLVRNFSTSSYWANFFR